MQWLIAFLTWLASTGTEIDDAQPRAAAAAAVAYATVVRAPLATEPQGKGEAQANCVNGTCPPRQR